MKLPHHVAASAVVSGALYAAFRSPGLTIASFLSGVFIDLDHLLDYAREHGITLDPAHFFDACHERQFERAVLVLHGWEWLAVLGVAAWLTAWNPWVLGALVGVAQHLALDQLHNRASRWGYSLVWRWKNGFLFERTFPDKHLAD